MAIQPLYRHDYHQCSENPSGAEVSFQPPNQLAASRVGAGVLPILAPSSPSLAPITAPITLHCH